MKCAVVKLNIYIIISSILKLRDTISALWNALNLTSLCPICLPAIQVSILHVTAYVDVTQLHCLSNITFLFHNQFDVSEVLLQKSRDPQVAENFFACHVPYRFTVVVARLHTLSITLLSQMNPIYTVPSHFCKVHFIMFSSTSRSSKILISILYCGHSGILLLNC